MLLLTVLASFGDWIADAAGSAGFWLLAMGGIGLVIFVHELGHFMAAKWCGVRVEAFAIGFGPKLIGFKRGDTEYRLGLLPIGGYVKMAGDNPGDALQGDGSDLPSKSVGQRFLIFVAGVVMNLIFALVALPIVLSVGVQFHSTRVGSVQAGGPAWIAGLAKGDEIVAVDDHRVDDFNDVIAEVALSGADGVELEVVRAVDVASGDAATRPTERLFVKPEYDRTQGRFVIGIGPALAPTFEVTEEGPAARAGVREGDRVVAFAGRPLASIDAFEPLRIENRAAEVTLRVVAADGGERDVVVTPAPAAQTSCVVGIKPFLNKVKAVRGRAAQADFLRVDDEVVALARRAEDGTLVPVASIADGDELAAAFAQAATLGAAARFVVRRGEQTIDLAPPSTIDAALAADIAFGRDPQGRRIRLVPDYPAARAGLPDGCEIAKVDQVAVEGWSDITQRVQKAAPEGDSGRAAPLTFTVVADGETKEVTVVPRVERPPVDFGLVPSIAMVERSYPFLEAVGVGVSSAGYMIKNVYLTLKKILVREVSASNLSGIFTIAYVSRSFAESGLATLFFFLAVLSLNLAFLNLLPIPVLDGGHLFFLLVEKVKGSPVSERVMGFSQLIGLVLVLALLLFVTYNDLRRFLL